MRIETITVDVAVLNGVKLSDVIRTLNEAMNQDDNILAFEYHDAAGSDAEEQRKKADEPKKRRQYRRKQKPAEEVVYGTSVNGEVCIRKTRENSLGVMETVETRK